MVTSKPLQENTFRLNRTLPRVQCKCGPGRRSEAQAPSPTCPQQPMAAARVRRGVEDSGSGPDADSDNDLAALGDSEDEADLFAFQDEAEALCIQVNWKRARPRAAPLSALLHLRPGPYSRLLPGAAPQGAGRDAGAGRSGLCRKVRGLLKEYK